MRKNLRYQLGYSGGIDDQRISQFDWTRSITDDNQPEVVLSDPSLC